MKAVGYQKAGPVDGAGALADIELPVPTPGPHDLLVQVAAVSVNPVDTKVRRNAAPAEGQHKVLGFDAAGTVTAVGSAVTLFKPGDAVFYAGDLTRPGTNAEYHLVDERIVGPKPASLDFPAAAALPLTAITAWEMLFHRMRVPYGVKNQTGTLLVIAGAGGVGSILIQLARRLTGLTVIATASRPETVAWVQKMGAHHVIDHRQPLAEGLRAIGIKAVDYVAALSNTDQHMPSIVEMIAPQGHLSVIDDPATFDVLPFKRRSVTISWEFMFTRSMFATADIIEQHRLLSEVSALVDAGLLQTTLTGVEGTINAANLTRLHQLLESGRSFGKKVLAGF
ncbi:zinc-binding alcohol dehydrogenase family protein [Niveispirillum sp. BGYR6]|uniref:zinc-binding alcohol dehydrogenase family protein n=1 Tax=Niveispirillum sp. BGYR6 TaxID=2971249 RepID=UPI0022B9BC47|nr:zinc-binding alcohol dehydrogenase family protein [Niveispirillum sp. BGYR6]MDG5493367.1 zinc-binding alcohol dehydrogenase family protein [Niveispirillum sp. BGYR6]